MRAVGLACRRRDPDVDEAYGLQGRSCSHLGNNGFVLEPPFFWVLSSITEGVRRSYAATNTCGRTRTQWTGALVQCTDSLRDRAETVFVIMDCHVQKR